MSTHPHTSQNDKKYVISYHDIDAAYQRIKNHVRYTPVHTSSIMNELASTNSTANSTGTGTGNVELYFKAEIFQRVGAFKFRGAYNTLAMINESLKGQQQHVNNDHNDNANVNVNVFVVTHSSGNHAQALALAARLFHFTAHIIMPSTSSQIKKDAVKQYGAVIHECQPNQQARESLANEVMNRLIETYGHQYVHFVHPYDQASIIAGQGTAAVEFIQQVKQLVTDNNNHNSNTSTTDDDDGMLDAIICPVGGGGLLSGTCISVKHLSPLTKIYAAEPLNANDCARSFQSKEYTTNDSPPKSIADGLLTNTGRSTYPIIMDHITDVITVTEDEIITAMKLIWTRMKLVIEPSTAVGVAAVLTQQFKQHVIPTLLSDVQRKRGQNAKVRIGIILEGGNVDINHLPF